MKYFNNLTPTYIPDINKYILTNVTSNSYPNFFDLQLLHFFKSNMIYFYIIYIYYYNFVN
jgi:hypothetical protein